MFVKIVYIFDKNSYAAAKAAYIHLRLNFSENFKSIIDNCIKKNDFYYLGVDAELNEIYLLYSNKCSFILKNLLQGLSDLYNEKILVICPIQFKKSD